MFRTSRMDPGRRRAVYVVLLFGLVSLFGDLIYEGARSVNGPYLQVLGADALLVGLVAGLGEFMGYGLRLLTGYFSDRTGSYWLFIIAGYGLIITVPMMSLTGVWQLAALLIVMERMGKAVRSPARDTELSFAAGSIGTGKGFGVSEFLDQIGAIAGPLMLATFFLATGAQGAAGYRTGYALFWVPYAALVAVVLAAYLASRRMARGPERREGGEAREAAGAAGREERLSRPFWLYTLFTFATAAGFASFILVGYHLKAAGLATDAQIPLLYAMAMGVDAVAALAAGWLYDRAKGGGREGSGLVVLVGIPVLTAALSPLLFSYSMAFVAAGVALWGVVMGMHETVMKAGIADMTALRKRGTGYGIFNSAYGLATLIGSVAIGALYDYSIPAVVALLVSIQAVALALFLVLRRSLGKRKA
jgi:MFS family permease